jgi:hypothetical protein
VGAAVDLVGEKTVDPALQKTGDNGCPAQGISEFLAEQLRDLGTKTRLPRSVPHLLLMAFLQRVTNEVEGAMDGADNNSCGVCGSKLRYSNRQEGQFETNTPLAGGVWIWPWNTRGSGISSK